MNIPELIVVGDIEFLFLGMALAAGMPRLARRILESRYGPSLAGNDEEVSDDELCARCPNPDDCTENGCLLERQREE
jgi:membrane protease subunit (stomatin/prohibitin family)